MIESDRRGYKTHSFRFDATGLGVDFMDNDAVSKYYPTVADYGLHLPTGGSVRVMRTTVVISRLRAMASSKCSI